MTSPSLTTHLSFISVPNDPIGLLQYTLSNGLQLFMSVNRDEPRVYTEIVVRAGSKHDPEDTTGLAHYFEHMMFKGTDRLGSLNWEKEKPLLDQIEQLFEEHRFEKDPERKKALYAEIDRLSFEAARYVAANEYDKLVSAIGARGTNAYTWVEQTVYVNDIPSNELERWFALESERFRRPVLRLFHTELETVFEEYNISQDRDFRKTLKAMQEALTPTHPYGTHTTLGRGEDLKNPSQRNIYRFFDQYYVPNNMAIVLCGDFDPHQAVAWAERYFGHFKPKPLPPFNPPPQPELTSRIQRDVYGQEPAWLELGWRFPGARSEEALILSVISGILHNYQAGLLDLNLIQAQRLLEASAFPRMYEEYSSLILYGKPREGQMLADVEALLLEQIGCLHRGEFEDWLPQAVVKDLKLSEIRQFEKNTGRASAITAAFIVGIPWADMVNRWKYLERLTKADIVAFAQRHLRLNNYVAVYKHHGDDPSVMKVEKPPITPVELNRTDLSAFAREFLQKTTPEIQPEFIDFRKALRSVQLMPGLTLCTIQQANSQLFRLYLIFEMGTSSDRRLGLAVNYLPYLGTSRYSPAQMQQAFYRIGAHFSANCAGDYLYLSLTGLSEAFEEALDLLQHLLTDLQPNEDALEKLKVDTLLRRENAKKDKRTILNKALYNYARYGKFSPYTDRLTPEELRALRAEELTGLLRQLLTFQHERFYCGPLSLRQVARSLRKRLASDVELRPPLSTRSYRERIVRRNRVFFVHFPMVQVELLLISKCQPNFDLEVFALSEWYNQYFGYGLSSIVFQEIREAKGLAYATYAYISAPEKRRQPHYFQAYVGTQPDKLREAVEAFQQLLAHMPVSPPQMEHARQSVLRQIAASRLTRTDIYWDWRTTRRRGFYRDLRQDIYQRMLKAKPEELIRFHEQHIANRSRCWLLLGDESRVDFTFLEQAIGPVQKLTLEEIFGY
ncbi:MAG: insulinase family protein [Saprospiraceae bacterium]|nr:insulinase family protein [Saprospiraceae bacterium]MDW8484566.1 insulinase family protein [Saprospiraceae bacterium]